jgi:hypothetical protein
VREPLVAVGSDLLGACACRMCGIGVERESADGSVGGEQRRSVVVKGVEEPAARQVRYCLPEEGIAKRQTYLMKNCPTKSRAPSLSKKPPEMGNGKTTASRFAAFAFSLLTRAESPGESTSPLARSCPTANAIDGSSGFWSKVLKVENRRAISLLGRTMSVNRATAPRVVRGRSLPFVGCRRSARVDDRVPSQNELPQFGPPFWLLVGSLLANVWTEGVHISELGKVVPGERDIFDVGKGSGEKVRRER